MIFNLLWFYLVMFHHRGKNICICLNNIIFLEENLFEYLNSKEDKEDCKIFFLFLKKIRMWLFSWLFWSKRSNWSFYDDYENNFNIDFVDDYDLFDFSYETFSVSKRNGWKREIFAPNKELKKVQKDILHKLEYSYFLPKFVTAFRKWISIKDNAKYHKNKKIVINIDIKDFFPSVKVNMIKERLKYYDFDNDKIEKFVKYTTVNWFLPQWAPTSPFIANFVFLPVDYIILNLLKKYDEDISYTRYADDITFSSDNENIKNAIRIITESILPKYGFQANKKKTTVYRNHRKQLVTWLVVNERVSYPRNKYIILRAKIYNFLEKNIWDETEIKGYLAFLRDVDYKKYKKLKKYYWQKFNWTDKYKILFFY